MAVKRQYHTEHGSLPKRVKTQTFEIGAAVTITHKVPRAKRIFAGQSGIVQASTGRIVDVTFTLQPKDAALYSDFLGADTTSCTAKFSTAHVDLYRERVLKLYSPFHLAAVQTRLGELLHPKSMMHLFTTAQNTVRSETLAHALAASLQRHCRLRGACSYTISNDNKTIKEAWAGFRTGAYLKKLAYAEVRDTLLSFIRSEGSGGLTLNAHGAALELLTHVGARFDDVILETLLQLKT